MVRNLARIREKGIKMNEVVRFTRKGREATLLIDRPEKLNALNAEVIQQLAGHLDEIEKENAVDVLLLKSAGDRAFVAGADIAEMRAMSSHEAAEFSRFGQRTFERIARLPAIVVAEIQGFALGGGLELALCADLIVASVHAKMGLPEVGLGLIPGFGGTQRLIRRIGYSRAIELAVMNTHLTAQQAFEWGLVNRLVESEEIDPETDWVVESILKQAPGAVKAAKKMIQMSCETSLDCGFEAEALAFGQRFSSPESREGISAFLEKRKPAW